MDRNCMKSGMRLLFGSAALIMWAWLLVPFASFQAQTPTFDLARDWSLEGTPFMGMPFGPDFAWSVCTVQLKPDASWQTFDRAMHFTISNPWLDLYGIDGWWLGSSPVPRKPMAGKNVGHGNIPGEVHGVNYDWPIGRVAAWNWPNPDQNKAEPTTTAVVWTAARSMLVRVTGGVWMAGQYQEAADHRSRVMMWIHRASRTGPTADEVIFRDSLIPLWTEGYDSAHPETLDQILGERASQLERIAVAKGDRIAIGFYWDGAASKPGLNGIDFQVADTREVK
jgi:hypothetical protein